MDDVTAARVIFDLLDGIAGPIQEGRIDPDMYFRSGAIDRALYALETIDPEKYAEVKKYY